MRIGGCHIFAANVVNPDCLSAEELAPDVGLSARRCAAGCRIEWPAHGLTARKDDIPPDNWDPGASMAASKGARWSGDARSMIGTSLVARHRRMTGPMMMFPIAGP